MNLFLIDLLIEKSASSLCDKHVVKMILETAQVLWCAWHMHKGDLEFVDRYGIKPYKKTHTNHPISIWIRAHANHYEYAVRYGLLLCHEYTLRYGKRHKCQDHLELLFWLGYPSVEQEVLPPKKAKEVIKAYDDIPGSFLYFPMCFDKEYIVYSDNKVMGIKSYQNYYRSKQDKFKMVWKTKVPEWF